MESNSTTNTLISTGSVIVLIAFIICFSYIDQRINNIEHDVKFMRKIMVEQFSKWNREK